MNNDSDVTSVLTDDLREQVAYDIWSHTDAKTKDVHCPTCGTYEPCEPCMNDIYRPAANAVLATVRRAIVSHHNGGPTAGESTGRSGLFSDEAKRFADQVQERIVEGDDSCVLDGG